MTPDRTDANPDENAEHGVLDEIGNLDTASITILGGHIAQVNVDLPVATDDDDLDDDVIEDEIPLDEADLAALDAPRVPSAASADDRRDEIVHDPHVEQLETGDIILEPHDAADETDSSADDEVHDAEIVVEPSHDLDEQGNPDAGHPTAREGFGDDGFGDDDPVDGEGSKAGEEAKEIPADGAASAEGDRPVEHDAEETDGADAEVVDDVADDDLLADVDPAGTDPVETDSAAVAEADADHREADATQAAQRADDLADAEVVDDVELFEADAAEPTDADLTDSSLDDDEPLVDDHAVDAASAPLTHAPWVPAAGEESEHGDEAAQAADDVEADDASPDDAVSASADREDTDIAGSDDADAPASNTDDEQREEVEAMAEAPESPRPPVDAPGAPESAASRPTAATAPEAEVDAPAAASPVSAETASVPTTRAERAATGVIGTIPLTRRSAHQADEAARAADEAARVDRAHALERVRTPAPEVTLTSKRIGQIDDARESSDLLTADRLLDPRQIARPEPEGLWQQLVYSVSRHRINLGDGRRARQRKDLDRRISAPLSGGARFVPVLSRKGGVGKTTVTSLLGMALADARDDRVIAVDANPDRGTLADRVGRPNGRTVRDLVRSHDEMSGYNDVSSIVARDATRLDVLASDSDPRVSEAFSDDDYRQVADVAAHYYSIVLTDTGTGIVHSVMGATLELADTLVIVAGLSVDEARLASETLTWLETNGYSARVRDAVVVLNNSRPGTPLVRESELEAHFRSRVRTVIRMPYDARIAAGSAITFRELQPSTRQAARELAAAVVEGLRTPAAAA
ncbi:MinD/ParA family protein [Microbacterium sp. SL62]|uniref:nucleotide-binding protein n=1 Tax=Microbacterium sp. SL62 TaxID=2995139 RepID=UPI0022727806|nr:MinD/ParA family protein [Microbacterium sp. SL62]MCY1716935.1 MinD/ParA family protein [Microbacterium sp. SL62]